MRDIKVLWSVSMSDNCVDLPEEWYNMVETNQDLMDVVIHVGSNCKYKRDIKNVKYVEHDDINHSYSYCRLQVGDTTGYSHIYISNIEEFPVKNIKVMLDLYEKLDLGFTQDSDYFLFQKADGILFSREYYEYVKHLFPKVCNFHLQGLCDVFSNKQLIVQLTENKNVLCLVKSSDDCMYETTGNFKVLNMDISSCRVDKISNEGKSIKCKKVDFYIHGKVEMVRAFHKNLLFKLACHGRDKYVVYPCGLVFEQHQKVHPFMICKKNGKLCRLWSYDLNLTTEVPDCLWGK